MTSLPLMGIGNPLRPVHSSSRQNAHYPSWGLETAQSSQRSPMPDRSHYPSWGLETGRVRYVVLAHLVLASLPLMGIGNCRLERPTQTTTRLSLPLMGIGNASSRPPRCCHRSGPPHYPSWGLETEKKTTVTAEASGGSLPLMGIGNVAAVRGGQPYRLALITPHGDWKPARRAPILRFQRKLITPHGDWKPTHVHEAQEPVELITPHGDWKHSSEKMASVVPSD